MEPVTRTLSIAYVIDMIIGPDSDASGFMIEGIPAKFVTTESPFKPGDRVKITITKEPTDAIIG